MDAGFQDNAGAIAGARSNLMQAAQPAERDCRASLAMTVYILCAVENVCNAYTAASRKLCIGGEVNTLRVPSIPAMTTISVPLIIPLSATVKSKG